MRMHKAKANESGRGHTGEGAHYLEPNRSMSSFFCSLALGHYARQTLGHRMVAPPSSLLILSRGNKKQAKKQTKSKKEVQRELMRDHFKRLEMEKLLLEAAIKAAKKGEALDPEMLNPARKRQTVVVPEEEKERRFLLVKQWSRYRMEQHKQELQRLHSLKKSRKKALRELKKVSLPLYSQALELNPALFPYECRPLTYTPPIPSYTPPDPDD